MLYEGQDFVPRQKKTGKVKNRAIEISPQPQITVEVLLASGEDRGVSARGPGRVEGKGG